MSREITIHQPAQQYSVQGFAIRAPGGKTVQGLQSLIAWRNAHAEAPDYWLRALVCEAFQHLFSRRMYDTPAADVIVIVAEDWVRLIGKGLVEEIDRDRLIAGFERIELECRRWPQPVDLMKRLALRIVKPQAGTINVTAIDEAAHERTAEALDKILESLT
jgi:hypothetical protein